MDSYRKYQVWDDYWCFESTDEPILDKLKTLDYYCLNPRKNDKVDIRIQSPESDSISPLEKQMEAYKFVVNNQDRIVDGIWNYYKDLILPVYRSSTNIEEDKIAATKSELSKVFGLKAIEIPTVNHFHSLYFLLEFDFCYDCEHGLYLLFKNDKPMDFFTEGTKDYDAIDIYEIGLYNADHSPLKINLCALNGESILTGEYGFEERIKFKLEKGVYRVFYALNNSNRVRNFIVRENMESFTLHNVLKNCEDNA